MNVNKKTKIDGKGRGGYNGNSMTQTELNPIITKMAADMETLLKEGNLDDSIAASANYLGNEIFKHNYGNIYTIATSIVEKNKSRIEALVAENKSVLQTEIDREIDVSYAKKNVEEYLKIPTYPYDRLVAAQAENERKILHFQNKRKFYEVALLEQSYLFKAYGMILDKAKEFKPKSGYEDVTTYGDVEMFVPQERQSPTDKSPQIRTSNIRTSSSSSTPSGRNLRQDVGTDNDDDMEH